MDTFIVCDLYDRSGALPERYNARGAFCFLARHRDIDGAFDVYFAIEFELFNSSRANLIFQFSDFCGNYSGARLRNGQVLVCDSRSFIGDFCDDVASPGLSSNGA